MVIFSVYQQTQFIIFKYKNDRDESFGEFHVSATMYGKRKDVKNSVKHRTIFAR